MRHARAAAIVVAALTLVAGPVAAQVTVNPGALDLLPSAPAKKPPPPRHKTPARHTAPEKTEARKPESPKPATAASKPPAAVANPNAPAGPPAAIAKPALPTIPPAIAALPPPAPVPAPRQQPAPVVPVAADAPGEATALPNGVRVTFGPTSQTFNPATEAAIRDLAAKLKPQDTTSINIYAYAAGTPDDVSTARRLSLARALAARAVLISAGIPSTRIYPRALGSAATDDDKDRVDVVAGPTGPPTSIAPAVLPSPPDQKAPGK